MGAEQKAVHRHPIHNIDKIIPIEGEFVDRIALFEERILKGQSGVLQLSQVLMMGREFGMDVIVHYKDIGRITGIG